MSLWLAVTTPIWCSLVTPSQPTEDLAQAVEIGAKAMALSLSREGAQESTPYRSEVLGGLSDVRLSR